MIRKNARSAGIWLREPEQRRVYAMHYCGLCHSLGDCYGTAGRLLTSHELTLLNLLASAQSPVAPEFVRRRCPLNPLRKMPGNSDASSRFAAAAAIWLAKAKFADDLHDSNGSDYAARWACRLLQPALRPAEQTLQHYGFDLTELTRLDELQARAERVDQADPAEPSARISASLFGISSYLADMPQNAPDMEKAGGNFGEFIYLRDALEDFPQDIVRQHYNPLRRFSHSVTGGVQLTREGIEWLLIRLEALLSNLRAALSEVQFHRYQVLASALLIHPVEIAVQNVAQHTLEVDGLYFSMWQPVDVLRAGLFLIPGALAKSGWTVLPIAENPFDGDDSQEHKRGPCAGTNTNCPEWFCYSGDCCRWDLAHCPTSDCLENCNTQECFCEHVTSGCQNFFDSSCLSHLGNVDCGNLDCSGLDCSNIDCGGADCSGVDCGGLDCPSG